jgi:hypothetical protein
MRKVIKKLASIQLAVVLMLALGIIIAWGTIVESRYDALAAAKFVYHTWWMYTLMAVFAINLMAVMADRWPWQKRHIPFLLAHIGIILLLVGSVFTMEGGLDGSMRVGIGETNRMVSIAGITDLQIWHSANGDNFDKKYDQAVDFLKNPPTREKPLNFQTADGPISIVEYSPYVFATRQIVASAFERMGSGLRFQIQNDKVNVNEWLLQNRKDAIVTHELGPARISLGLAPKHPTGVNEIFLSPVDKDTINYTVFNQDPKKKTLQGKLKEGGSVSTGWMGLELKVLRYFYKAEESWDFKPNHRPTELTTSMAKVLFQGREREMQLNDVLKFFTDKGVYIISYGNRRVDLGFNILLNKFEIGKYPGTNRAASYQSLVTIPDGTEHLIYMNEPLKYRGLTFYQASFQDGPNGEPIASIFSVNQDPGRWIKYLGSLILSLGVVWLFYSKRKSARAQAPSTGDFNSRGDA